MTLKRLSEFPSLAGRCHPYAGYTKGPRCRGRRDAATELVVGNLTSYFIEANERAGLFRRAYRRVAPARSRVVQFPAVHKETAFPPPLRASIAVLLSHVVDPFCFIP
jgi:hypothetical protein